VTGDDRAQFADERRAHIASLAAGDDVRRADAELIEVSDRHGYSYVWDWLGVPIIQMPSDIVVMQEIIWRCRPQLVVETGVARGGSLVLSASILELVGEGRVVGVDIDIRPHNRRVIEAHPLAGRIELVEGSSVAPEVVAAIKERTAAVERVMVCLDSDHTHDHVLAELRAYAPLVSPGQYLVVADTVVEELPVQAHRPRAWGPGDNPMTAVHAFLAESDDFAADPELNGKLLMSSSRGGYLRRRS
jgi:cephalosporin hydroxylase